MPEPSRKLGKYDILGEAGRGSMGVVYIGHDPFVDRKVAIKVLAKEDNPSDPAAVRARKMFFNEAQSAGSLDHPNILRVYEAGEVDGQPYMVMEFVDGAETLRDYTHPEVLLPVDRVLDLMAQCASALDYAHQRGVTHRDIKPANIMLTAVGAVKIVDFGIAQRSAAEKTQVMGVAGSPRYMAPEQARDEGVTNQSDLYSLGVVTYELLTGNPPFDAKTIPNLLYKLLHEDPIPIASFRPDLPEAVQRVVYRAMEKDRADRYRSGLEMEADILAVRKGSSGRPELSAEDQIVELRALPFLADFPEGDVLSLHKAGRWERHSAGAAIVTQGEDHKAFFLLVSGRVAVERDGVQVAQLKAGECFGEMSYLSGAGGSATVRAITGVEVFCVRAPLFEWASLPSQMRFNKAFQQVLIRRLSETTDALAERERR